ncbi:MAG: hypothetical protein ABI867_19725 [Kofleriaceae bacterium]
MLAIVLPLATAPACTSTNTSTKGQLIECAVDANGNTTNCGPADDSTPSPGTCHDIDEDGDDDPDDVDETEDDKPTRAGVVPGDSDDDGTPDSEDEDDDNDGVDDADDCDELPGHDSDDDADVPEGP